MTNMYRTEGRLTNPVNDQAAGNAYLQQDDMAQYFGLWGDTEALKGVVFDARWSLTSEDTWQVVIITTRALTPAEASVVSEWISGQNSDGLGEGFEQQPFAEIEGSDPDSDYDQDEDWAMASFDWETNPCTLELLK